MSYQDLSFPHDAVCAFSILFVVLGLVVALLIAEQPQGLRALQLNLKLLRGTTNKSTKCENVIRDVSQKDINQNVSNNNNEASIIPFSQMFYTQCTARHHNL